MNSRVRGRLCAALLMISDYQ
eukprot:COSAG05_NODE_18271_length_311_cov_0.518868_1_plen_20_part_10